MQQSDILWLPFSPNVIPSLLPTTTGEKFWVSLISLHSYTLVACTPACVSELRHPFHLINRLAIAGLWCFRHFIFSHHSDLTSGPCKRPWGSQSCRVCWIMKKKKNNTVWQLRQLLPESDESTSYKEYKLSTTITKFWLKSSNHSSVGPCFSLSRLCSALYFAGVQSQ